MRLDQRVERDLDDQVGVEFGEEGQGVADAFMALVAVPERGDECRGVTIGTQLADERERLLLFGGRRIVMGHWTRALPGSRRQTPICLAEQSPISLQC